jgi:hypothetical protein
LDLPRPRITALVLGNGVPQYLPRDIRKDILHFRYDISLRPFLRGHMVGATRRLVTASFDSIVLELILVVIVRI